MNIVGTAKTVFTNSRAAIKAMTPLERCAKGVAVLGAGALLYDAHSYGKEKGSENRIDKDAEAGYDYFKNTQYLDGPSKSVNGIKNYLFHKELTNSLRGAVNGPVGYVKGLASSLFTNLIPLEIGRASCRERV